MNRKTIYKIYYHNFNRNDLFIFSLLVLINYKFFNYSIIRFMNYESISTYVIYCIIVFIIYYELFFFSILFLTFFIFELLMSTLWFYT